MASYVPINTDITRLRTLDASEAEKGMPFEIRGLVTYHDTVHPFFYLQHYSGDGVRVVWRGTKDLPAYSDQVTVFGHATNGLRIPYLLGREFELRGARTNPVPTRWIGGSGFRSGEESGRRMRMNAVVRSVRPAGDEDVAVVRFGREGNVFRARVQLHGEALPTDWVDAKVMIQGVSAEWQPSPDAFLEQIFLIQRPEDVVVTIAAPADPYGADPQDISAILAQQWNDRFIHRVRVDGVVTYASEQKIFVEDDSGGIEVRPREALTLKHGDRVWVAGFPTRGQIVPFLEESMIRRVSGGALPSAKSAEAAEVLGSDLNGRLIRTKGKVLGHPRHPVNRMELSDAGQTFTALIPHDLPTPASETWPVGAVIEVIGVCQFQGGGEGDPGAFLIRLNDAASVTILSPPSWWTPERTRLTAAGLILLALGAIGWAAFFRNRARQNRTQFLTSFHANPMPAWIIRQADGTCLEINGEFERMFALARTDVIGRGLTQLWSSEKEGREFVERLRTHPSVRAEEAHLQSHEGKDRNVLLSTESILVDGENCVLLIAYDVTERLRLLEQLRQSQKMEAIGQLAAGIAHDFNNLMTVVRGNAGLLSDEPLSKDAQMLTDEIEDASRRAAELTSQMLAFSRKSIMRPRIVDLRDVLQTAAGMLNRMIGETIEVSYHCPQESLLVKADAVMLDQVLLNLGVNARDAMPEGGTLTMTARLVDYDADNLPPQAEAQPGSYVLVEVEDTGTGMSEDVKQHIFDPFFTTKDIGQGTGLGLSTAYGILRQHGGWIAVESQLDQGSKFTLHLPSTTRPTEEANREIPSDGFGHGTETILMVDDDDRVRQSVSRTLKHYGYRVLEANDGPTAEKLWSEQRDEIDLVLTDLVMPNGCSGLELGRRLQAEKPDLKIIYMTGHSQELLEHGGHLVADVDFLPKPFENRDLVRLIRERLDGSSTVANAAEDGMKSLA